MLRHKSTEIEEVYDTDSTNTAAATIIIIIMYYYYYHWGTRWRSWLRHWATRQQVAGSIPDAVNAIFHWHNPSGRSTALELTQPLTETSTGNISWGVKAAGE